MALTRDTLAERKLKLLMRARFRLGQQFEYEEWKERVLYPMLEKVKGNQAVPELGLEAGDIFDFKVSSDYSDSPQEPDAPANPDSPAAGAGDDEAAGKNP